MRGQTDLERVSLLGSWIHTVDLGDAVQEIIGAASNGRGGHVCLANAHTVSLGRIDKRLQEATNSSLLTLADGRPLVWMAKLLGVSYAHHVRGTDLLRATCAIAARNSLGVYFYGGAPGVTARLAETLVRQYPGLVVKGYDSPPYRPLTPREDAEAIERIRSSEARILWVGLGAPKQEIWMLEHQSQLPAVVMVGVGAAFDFLGGSVPEAPRWLQKSGLEWVHRMWHDPLRLSRRYIVFNSRFLFLASAQIIRSWSGRNSAGRVEDQKKGRDTN